MQYIICYDISDDRRRSHVSSLLQDFGTRVQESVFVAHLDQELVERMMERLTRAVDLDWDKVHVFQQCGACEKGTVVIGQGELVHDPQWFIL